MPIPNDYAIALKYLDDNKAAALPALVDADRVRVLAELRDIVERLYERKPEDLRAAVSMAVDAAKTLVTIAIAFFVAIGGFIVQYVGTHDSIWSATLWLLVLAALAGIASMIAGFFAIGQAFKNAQGISLATATRPMWSTEPMKGYLDFQSFAGLAGLVLFGFAVLFWSSPPTGGLAATPVSLNSPVPSVGSKIRIEGTWSNLTVRRGGLSISAPAPSSAGQTQALEVEVR
jgi:hypothetical protein